MACIFSAVMIRRNQIPLRFRPKEADLAELPEMVRHGLPTTGNTLMDNVVAGIINNLIVTGFGGDTTALSVYTAVKGVITFSDTSLRSIQTSVSPLLGILYGSRDRSGIVRTVKEGFKLGAAASFAWCSVLFLRVHLSRSLLYRHKAQAMRRSIIRSGRCGGKVLRISRMLNTK